MSADANILETAYRVPHPKLVGEHVWMQGDFLFDHMPIMGYYAAPENEGATLVLFQGTDWVVLKTPLAAFREAYRAYIAASI